MPRMRQTRQTWEPPIYTFRVRILQGFFAPVDARSIWREIEVAANQTLADLGNAIPLAFDFDDPHLWSFFFNGKAWDTASEYALTSPEDDFLTSQQGIADVDVDDEPVAHLAKSVKIQDAPFPGTTGKREFLFLFDYGDEWRFGVKLMRQSPTIEPGARYPRVVASAGDAPPQYPLLDEEEYDEEGEVLDVESMDDTGGESQPNGR